MEMNFKCSVKKNVIYWLIHIDFQIQEIFPERLANLINKRVQIFPVSESQGELIAI